MAEDTRSDAPPSVSGADIRTFLFADFRGYTRYTQEHGDEAASALTSRFAELVRATVPEFEGELLELRGDEALCVFRSARQALRASVELQRRLRTGSDEEAAFPIGVGMGLDAGEAIPTEGGYRGTSLNLAARLCALAKPGEILATEGVAHLAQRVHGLRMIDGRSATVKGIARPVRFVLVVPEIPLPPLPPPLAVQGRRGRRFAIAGAAFLLVVVSLGVWVDHRGGSPRASTVLVHPDSLVVLDAQDGHIVRDIQLRASPGTVAGGMGSVWVGSDASQTITRVDPTTYRTDPPIGLGMDPAQLTVAFRSVWAYDAFDDRLAEVDPAGLTPPVFKTPVPCGQRASGQCGVGGLTADGSSLWLGECCVDSHDPSGLGSAWRLDPKTLTSTLVRHVPSDRLAYGRGQLWAYGANGFFAAWISRLTNKRVPFAIPNAVATSVPTGLTVAFGSAWIVTPRGTVLEYQPTGLQQSVPIPTGGSQITATSNELWIVGGDGTVTQLNPATLRTRVIAHLNHQATGIASFGDRVWIAVGAAA